MLEYAAKPPFNNHASRRVRVRRHGDKCSAFVDTDDSDEELGAMIRMSSLTAKKFTEEDERKKKESLQSFQSSSTSSNNKLKRKKCQSSATTTKRTRRLCSIMNVPIFLLKEEFVSDMVQKLRSNLAAIRDVPTLLFGEEYV